MTKTHKNHIFKTFSYFEKRDTFDLSCTINLLTEDSDVFLCLRMLNFKKRFSLHRVTVLPALFTKSMFYILIVW